MDLRVTTERATDEERTAVDAVLGAATTGWAGGARSEIDRHVAYGGRAAREARRDLLLPVFHSLQEKVGWISQAALGYLCSRLDIAPAEAFGVASAYELLSLEPMAQVVVHVCDDIACRARSGGDPCGAVRSAHGPAGTERGALSWKPSPCLGHCEHGSAALVQRSGDGGGRVTVAPFDAAALERVATSVASGPGLAPPVALVPQASADRSPLRLLRRVGVVDPTSIDAYRAAGGYEALRRALALGPEGVLSELKAANLLGRGGAAFPTAAKWSAVAHNPVRPHFFVANADESEPGTFKDRVLLEADPFALVEAVTIAGIVTGAERGFLYLRGEYPLAEKRLEGAIAQAKAHGLLGDDVMSSGHVFELEIRRGAGAYIAGEETALFNSIEGLRPEPRNKPPFPVDRGLFGKPTGINNVETLLCVLEVLSIGGAAFASIGTASSSGTRLFCVSGCVASPGLYEVPLGTTLRELLELAGGVRDGRELRSVLLGGAAGSFVVPAQLDIELSFEAVRFAGTTLGSGVVMVMDDTVDIPQILQRIAQFFRDESCGQCVPCRVGTVRQEELLGRLSSRRLLGSVQAERTLLADLGTVMRDSSICGLGQTASSAIESAVAQGLLASLEEVS
ncbi:MAG: NADH-ubiquinone oxidoreductase-F iron-sulfur binding region domain-containing protein [Acidimicrobiales bacterium]